MSAVRDTVNILPVTVPDAAMSRLSRSQLRLDGVHNARHWAH